MANGKLIAVNGPPGSGKTTLTLKLAQEVHEKTKKKVLYISPDTQLPAMSIIFPRREKEMLFSLGAALANVNLAITDFHSVIATTAAMPNMGYTGYIASEGPYSYPALQEGKVVEMFQILRDNFDYIFVDCDRNREDLISNIACGLSDCLIQIINPDIKSIAYYGFEPAPEKAIQILNLLDKDVYLPIQDIKTHFPKIKYTVLYSRAVKMQMYNGELMDCLQDKVYLKSTKPIVDMLTVEPVEEPVTEEMPEEVPEADPLEAAKTEDFWQ